MSKLGQKVKVGIIGCGTVAGYGHLPTAANHPDFELYAISELDKTRLNEIGDKYSIPKERRFLKYQELLMLPELEAVTVSTRVEQHHQVALDAAKSKKHIFCEKPVAPTVEEGWEMVEAARLANVILLIDLHNRVKSSVQLMLKYLRQNQIGKLHTIRMVHLWYGADNVPRADGRSRRDLLSEEGGGPIVDCGVHCFDLARLFAGSDYKKIHAIGQWVEKKYTNPGHVISSSIFKNGIIAVNEQSWVYTNTAKPKNVVHQIELIGTQGLISTNWDWDPKLQKYHGEIVRLFNAEGYKETMHDVGKPFEEMYHRFAQMIRTGVKDPDLAYGEDGILAMESAFTALNDCKNLHNHADI
jgi:predicted dehydrogenase